MVFGVVLHGIGHVHEVFLMYIGVLFLEDYIRRGVFGHCQHVLIRAFSGHALFIRNKSHWFVAFVGIVMVKDMVFIFSGNRGRLSEFIVDYIGNDLRLIIKHHIVFYV